MKTQDSAPSPAVVTAEEYREKISLLPTGVTVITAPGPEGPVGCTANSVMSLSLNPPSLLLSLGTKSQTLTHILGAGVFAVNVLSYANRALTRQFATGTARERFAGVPWHTVHGMPVLTRSSVCVGCVVRETLPLLDHTLLVGEVTWMRASDAAPTVLYRHQQYDLAD